MGSIGQTLFGGSKQDQTSSSSNLSYPAVGGSLGPAMDYATAGGDMLGSLLGVPGYGSPSAGATGGGGRATYTSAYTGPTLQQIQAMKSDGIPGNYKAAMAAYGQPTLTRTPGTGTGTGTGGAPVPQTQGNALQTFADSAGMKFLQDNGNRAIDNNQAMKGLLQSGATAKGIENYNKNLSSTYLNDYLQNLFKFSNIGLTAGGIVSDAGRVSSGSGNSSSKPGLIPGMQQAAASIAAAG